VLRLSRRPPRRAGTAEGRGGFALVMVLFLVVLLAVVVAGLSLKASGAYRLARSRDVSWRLYYASRAALEEQKAALWRELISNKGAGQLYAAPKDSSSTIDGVEVKIAYEDEAGKFPINDFASPDATRRKDLTLALARLLDDLKIPGSTSLATAARDFIDTDGDGPKESGAKNGPLFDASELLALQGLEPDMLYKVPYGSELPSLAACVTTWHNGKINLNGAPGPVIKAFSPRLTDAEVKAIIAARAERPFTAADDFQKRSGVSNEAAAELLKAGQFTSDTFSVKLEARDGAFARRMQAVVWLESSAAHTLYVRDGWQL